MMGMLDQLMGNQNDLQVVNLRLDSIEARINALEKETGELREKKASDSRVDSLKAKYDPVYDIVMEQGKYEEVVEMGMEIFALNQEVKSLKEEIKSLKEKS